MSVLSAKLNTLAPFVTNTCPLVPSAVGNVMPPNVKFVVTKLLDVTVPSATVTFCELPKKLNVVPSNVKLSEPLNTLPLASATTIVLAFAVPNEVVPVPTTASIVITLSFNDIVAFEPACSL